jgi:hypothetical protein
MRWVLRLTLIVLVLGAGAVAMTSCRPACCRGFPGPCFTC